MGRRWVDGIGSLTSAGAVNTSTATSRSAKIRANGPMCAAARGSSENGQRHSKQFLPSCCCSSTFFRARHIFELTRTASGALHATRTGFHRGAVARISRVETRGGSIANVACARRDKRGAAEAAQRGGVTRNVCPISSWRTTSAWTARTSEPTGRSRESWCSKGSGYLPRPSTASPSSPLGWC
jgi:hypothetical protein